MVTNNAANFGTGTAGQVLTSNGAGVAPTFQSGGSGTVTSVSGTTNQVAVATGTTTPVISLVGPYTPATYTAHGVLIGEGTSSIVALAAGSAGQALLSGGASANPAYSTPTYPSTSGTARTILVSDATNNVYSTETWAVPSTSGNVLTSDGTNWTSAAAPAGNLLLKTVTLTSAQIKAIHGTPIEIIAAPGAGKGIVVLNAGYKFTYGGTNVFVAGASQTIAVYYNNNTTLIVPSATTWFTNTVLVGTTTTFKPNGGVGATVSAAAGVYDNVNVAAFNPVATEISGNAANNNTADIFIAYYIVTF